MSITLTQALAALGAHIEAQDKRIAELSEQLASSAMKPATIRINAGITPQELAEKAGLDVNTIYHLEAGRWKRQTPPTGSLQKIQTALGHELGPAYVSAVVNLKRAG